MSTDAALPDGGTPAGRGVLAATCVSTLVVNANTSAVSILLPAISADVGSSTTTLQWAVTGYSLVGAAVIVTGGVLGDIAGRRKVFIGALLLFVASCVLIALSRSGAGVIAGRAIQGAAGSTLLACGMSLLSVGSSGAGQMRAVSLWGAASAVGAAAGPLVGGALVDTTGWQGLFWIDAAIAAACIPLTLATVAESRDPERPRSIDVAGTLLVAATLVPFVLALTKGTDWGWGSALTLGCFAVSIAAGFGFVAVERRVRAPLLDLGLLRNKVLVGATLAILIGAGTINGLMFVVSLYFQDPAGLGMSPLEAGLATLPATVGLIVVSPFVSDLATRIGSRQTIGLGFVVTTAGFLALVFVTGSWAYGMFVLPLVAIAVGMGFTNGCASSASTATVSQNQVGAASGVSNMARYVGAALVTAAVATIYGSAAADAGSRTGAAGTDALVDGVAASALLMTIASALGIALVLLAGRDRPAGARTVDRAAAAAAIVHTLPDSEGGDMTPAPFTAEDFATRMRRAAEQARDAGLAGVLITPGPDLIYFTGYAPIAITERITMLVLRHDADPALIVPILERPDAEASPAAPALRISDWRDGQDPYASTAALLTPEGRYAISDSAWAMHVLGLQRVFPRSGYAAMTSALPMLRAIKDDSELARLAAAGAAADASLEALVTGRFAGRSERAVGADLAALLRENGHSQVDFTVVGSGPNGANPHHELGDRVIEDGDMIVLDFGGLKDGYGSDTTRMVRVGGEPSGEEREVFEIVRRAQQTGFETVRPGVTCEQVDRATRQVIADAGYGDYFIHRTGHGIGLTTHEPPYIVEGETQELVPGMCFSIEPGIYLPGRFGVRIEDIVTVTANGGRRLNNTTHDLRIVA